MSKYFENFVVFLYSMYFRYKYHYIIKDLDHQVFVFCHQELEAVEKLG